MIDSVSNSHGHSTHRVPSGNAVVHHIDVSSWKSFP